MSDYLPSFELRKFKSAILWCTPPESVFLCINETRHTDTGNCSGIKLGKRQLTKQREVDHVEWQKRYRGICNQSEYYIGVPTKRRETYKEEIPVYSLNAESIKVCILICVTSDTNYFAGVWRKAHCGSLFVPFLTSTFVQQLEW